MNGHQSMPMPTFISNPSGSLSRRTFLAGTATTVAAFYVGRRTSAAALTPARKLTASVPQVFVDLNVLDSAENIHQLFHTAEKHPANPVLLGESKWERKQGGPCGAFIYDDQEQLFKAWYQGVIGTEFGSPATGRTR